MKILNFGSLNIDYTYDVKSFVKSGMTIKASQLTKNIGGKGLNQSIALARAGADVYHAGAVGEEGRFLVDYLRENGVDTSNILHSDSPSGHAIIQVDEDGKNCIIIYGGANVGIPKSHINNVLSLFNEGDLLLLQNEINDIDYIARKAKEKKMIIALNPSPVTDIDISMEMVDFLLLNEHEAESLFGESDIDRLIEKMVSMYPDMKFVLTLGENGSVYVDKNETVSVKAVQVKAVDTTAAGDTFTGFFLTSFFAGNTPRNSLELASKAASVTVSRNGAAETIPNMNEL